ncbi:hypothetical protein ABPG72_004445 [Tetrahymena utriculariae]
MEIVQIQNSLMMLKYCEFDSTSYFQHSQEIAKFGDINQIQILHNFDQGNSNYQGCQQCNMNLFSLCYFNYSSIKNGYSRYNLTVNQDQIYMGKISSQNCVGGDQFGNYLCA